MRINYNVSAMLSNNALANNDTRLADALERLSSGLKINHAKDNPAGLAIAKRMNAQIEGLNVASQNSSDGVSIIETADGAMSEIAEMLQRINELSVQACNGSNSEAELENIQAEVDQLKAEISRISDTTEFNGQKLLNGEFAIKGYTSEHDITVSSISSTTPAGEYMISDLTIAMVTDPATGEQVRSATCTLGPEFPAGATVTFDDDFLTIRSGNVFEVRLDLKEAELGTYNDIEVEISDIGPMRLQIGANEGQVLGVEIPTVSLREMRIEDIDLSTPEGAKDSLERIGNAISYVSSVRGKLGAYQNRLESTVNSLDITSTNMTSAYSRIMDVDMATEMTNYTTAQVLTQAGTSMLAQANERPSQVLQLLQ